VGGLAVPNIGGALRTLWPELLRRRDDLIATAYALDSVALELLFTLGPLIAAVVIAIASPASALVLSAACSLAGTLAFIARPPSRNWRPDADAGSQGWLGPLRSPGVRTIVLSSVPVGFCFGAVEISLPAFAQHNDARELAGVLLATWSIGSAVGGLAYGARTWPGSLGSVYLWLSVLLPLGYLPALLAPSIAAMALLILPAGLLIAPLAAAGNELIGRIAPAGAVTEAYAWPVTAILVGFAAGSAVGGMLIDVSDWQACFVAAAAAAALGAAVVYRFRGTLSAPEPVMA
jgi:predicted MFS family arabinose efflux permease